MPHNSYSDEPRLIKPAATDRRFLAFVLTLTVVILAGLCVGGGFMYRNWQEEQSHLAERGIYEGTLYTIDINGQPARLELGWQGDRLLPVVNTPGLQDAVLRVKGKFGEEALKANPQYKSAAIFGPTEARIDPFKHYKLDLSLERDGQILWSGKLWAWGIHHHHHHH